MKNKRLLEMLADFLEKNVSDFDFNMSNTNKDALYYATRIPAFKRAGFILAQNDNDPNRRGEQLPSYKGKFEIEAAMAFFDLDIFEARHLFSENEQDPWGYPHNTIFEHAANPTSRSAEPPGYCAARLRIYARKGKAAYMPETKDVHAT